VVINFVTDDIIAFRAIIKYGNGVKKSKKRRKTIIRNFFCLLVCVCALATGHIRRKWNNHHAELSSPASAPVVYCSCLAATVNQRFLLLKPFGFSKKIPKMIFSLFLNSDEKFIIKILKMPDISKRKI